MVCAHLQNRNALRNLTTCVKSMTPNVCTTITCTTHNPSPWLCMKHTAPTVDRHLLQMRVRLVSQPSAHRIHNKSVVKGDRALTMHTESCIITPPHPQCGFFVLGATQEKWVRNHADHHVEQWICAELLRANMRTTCHTRTHISTEQSCTPCCKHPQSLRACSTRCLPSPRIVSNSIRHLTSHMQTCTTAAPKSQQKGKKHIMNSELSKGTPGSRMPEARSHSLPVNMPSPPPQKNSSWKAHQGTPNLADHYTEMRREKVPNNDSGRMSGPQSPANAAYLHNRKSDTYTWTKQA